MASAETHLPAIDVVPSRDATVARKQRKDGVDALKSNASDPDTRAASFLAGFRLGVVQKEPRPGDVYRPLPGRPHTSAAQPRPLGLLPDRGAKISALKQLNRILSPFPALGPASAPVGALRRAEGTQGDGEAGGRDVGVAEKLRGPSEHQERRSGAEESGGAALGFLQSGNTPFRLPGAPTLPQGQDLTDAVKPVGLPCNNLTAAIKPVGPARHDVVVTQLVKAPEEIDPTAAVAAEDLEYMDTLAKCNIKEYGISEPPPPLNHPVMGRSRTLPSTTVHRLAGLHLSKLCAPAESPEGKKEGKRPHNRSSSLEYVNFTGQAQLWNRLRTLDCRDAKDYIPCERCRLRGGRCSKCKAIRTGGGYIILDGTQVSGLDMLRRGKRGSYGFGGGAAVDYSAGRQRRIHSSAKDRTDSGVLLGSGSGYGNTGGDERGGLRSSGEQGWGGEGGGGGGVGGGWREGGSERGGDGRGDGWQGGSNDWVNKTVQGRGSGMDSDLRNHDDGRDNAFSGKAHTGSTLTRPDSSMGGGGADGRDSADGYNSGRQSSASQRPRSVLGSRPGSRLASRPSSSLKKFGRGFERRDRGGRDRELETHSRGGRVRGHLGEGGEGDGGSDDEEGRRRRRRRGRGLGEDEEEEEDGKDRLKGQYVRYRHEEEEDEEERGRYTGDLMRFKSKRNDVKALKCTLKELQAIDPLDYLAKYCIIDQNKLPEYRRVYENVDRDEDDEITISELDYGLKAVNYNLITDAEMNYVHSVLELAGRYKLNFHLFSLIAALSEKVVALEDMVKRLVNSMDFEALEVKIKKCKELFYLLADAEASEDDDGGRVTTASLAVELQAGGLTPEHVEFVVDRLNHEGKGKVEFLDYLTYVPLFVEIHDAIYGNPLDFSRTR